MKSCPNSLTCEDIGQFGVHDGKEEREGRVEGEGRKGGREGGREGGRKGGREGGREGGRGWEMLV